MPKGSVGNIIGAPMTWESQFTVPFQAFSVDNPVCNNWADVGLPEVFNDPDLASFNGATTQTAAGDDNPLRQAGDRRVRDTGGRRPGLPPGGGPHQRLLGPDHRDAPGQLRHPGVDVHRRSGERHRRGLGETGGRYGPPLFQHHPQTGKRAATSQGVPVRQRRPGGQRAGRRHAEHAWGSRTCRSDLDDGTQPS